MLNPDTHPHARAAALLVLPALFLGYWPAAGAQGLRSPGMLAASALLGVAALVFYGTAFLRLGRALLAAPAQPRALLPPLLLAACWFLLPFQRGRLVDPSFPILLVAALATTLGAVLALLAPRARPGLAAPAGMAVAALFGVHAAVADHDSVLRRVGAFPTDAQLVAIDPVSPDWNEVAAWARANTDIHALFLIPPNMTGFETPSRRRVWYDTRQGAATMWAPGFYEQWRGRRGEVAGLNTLADAVRYGCEHGVDYVVVDLRPDDFTIKLADGQVAPGRVKLNSGPGRDPEPVFGNRSFRVFSTAPCPAGS